MTETEKIVYKMDDVYSHLEKKEPKYESREDTKKKNQENPLRRNPIFNDVQFERDEHVKELAHYLLKEFIANEKQIKKKLFSDEENLGRREIHGMISALKSLCSPYFKVDTSNKDNWIIHINQDQFPMQWKRKETNHMKVIQNHKEENHKKTFGLNISVSDIINNIRNKISNFDNHNKSNNRHIKRNRFWERLSPPNYKKSYNSIKGTLVHQSFEDFTKEYLPNLPLQFSAGKKINDLWKILRKGMFQCLFKKIKKLQEEKYPQIQAWFGNILFDSYENLKSLLKRLHEFIRTRSSSIQTLQRAINVYLPIMQEENLVYEYKKNIKIWGKPDWISSNEGCIKITDFKTGDIWKEKKYLTMIQVGLYALLFSKIYGLKVEKCEMFFTHLNKKINFPYDEKFENFLKSQIDNFLEETNDC